MCVRRKIAMLVPLANRYEITLWENNTLCQRGHFAQTFSSLHLTPVPKSCYARALLGEDGHMNRINLSGFTAPGVFVFAIWIAMTVAAFAYVGMFTSPYPFGDEWDLIGGTVGQEPFFPWLWHQHNEHRLPLPKLMYGGLMKITGQDVRAGSYATVLLLAGLSAAFVYASRRIRGHVEYSDAFFPIALLNYGGFENYLIGFQISFAMSAGLACAMAPWCDSWQTAGLDLLRAGIACPLRCTRIGLRAAARHRHALVRAEGSAESPCSRLDCGGHRVRFDPTLLLGLQATDQAPGIGRHLRVAQGHVRSLGIRVGLGSSNDVAVLWRVRMAIHCRDNCGPRRCLACRAQRTILDSPDSRRLAQPAGVRRADRAKRVAVRRARRRDARAAR